MSDPDRPSPEVLEEMDRVYGEPSHDHDWVHPRLNKPDPHAKREAPLGADMVVLPKHYAKYQIEPIRFLAENRVNNFQFNIVKYTMRAEDKHDDKGLEDLLKTVRYSMMYAKFLQGDPDWWKPYRVLGLAQMLREEITNGPRR